MERMIAGRFGPQWFHVTDTGEGLKALWALGQRPLPRELAETLGGAEFDALDYAAVLEERLREWKTR